MKHDGDALERLRAETRRAFLVHRVFQLVTLIGCLAALDMLARCHAPQAREEMIDGVREWVRGAVMKAGKVGDAQAGRIVAMAPLNEKMLVGLVMAAVVVFVIAAVRKVYEQDLWIEQLRKRRITELHDPLADVTDGLTCDEMHRILTSVAAEAREVRRLQIAAQTMTDAEDRDDALETATRRMHALIGCVEALMERLQPEIS